MMDAVNWIIEHGEKIGGYLILLGISYAFMTGWLWSKKAVETRIGDFEKREAKINADCDYNRMALERVLGELERASSNNLILARALEEQRKKP
jgi:hypothetical protein